MLRRKAALAMSAVALILAPVMQAQIRSATITGTVTDAAGAVIPDAVVVVTQQETDITTTVKTTAGGFSPSGLPRPSREITLRSHERAPPAADGGRYRISSWA